jgi:hypothetical protein
MKKLFTISCFSGFFAILLLFSCSQEDNLTSSQTQSINNAKEWFESNNDSKSLKILKYTKEILWQNAIVSNGENGQVIEVPLTLVDNIATTNSKTKPLRDHHRLMFLKDENDNFKSYHIQIFTDDITYNNLDKKFTFYNINDGFNGLVTVFDTDSQSVNLLKFKNGLKTKPNISSRMGEDEITCTYLGYLHEDGTFEPIALLYCIGDSDSEGTGGGGGYGSGPMGGGVTTTTVSNPCDQMKNVMNYNPNDSNSLKSSLNWLKDKVNAAVNDKECGVEVRKKMNYDESYRYEFTQVLSNEQFSVALSTDRDNVGASHSHPSDGYAMFSFQDVRFLLATYDGAFDNRKGEVFNSVVCKDKAGNTNTYM